MTNLLRSVFSAVLILSSGGVSGAPFVVNSAGTKIEGAAIQSGADGTISLTTAQGQTLTFRPGAYRQACADKPKEISQIEAMVKRGEFSGAGEILRQVKTKYRFLGWDIQAARMLARVELAQKNFPDAAAEYEALFAVQTQLKTVPAERANYMQALLGSGRISEVAGMVDEDIASGSREAAARAQVIRGDMKFESKQYEEALLDYLRTVLLFREQTAALPEATYKAAVALKKMKDPRAAEYFQKVIAEFPDSEFAARVRKEGE